MPLTFTHQRSESGSRRCSGASRPVAFLCFALSAPLPFYFYPQTQKEKVRKCLADSPDSAASRNEESRPLQDQSACALGQCIGGASRAALARHGRKSAHSGEMLNAEEYATHLCRRVNCYPFPGLASAGPVVVACPTTDRRRHQYTHTP